MNHPDLVKNHIIENWVFANAAARNSGGAYQTYDIGKIAYQVDNGSYWRLTATTPTWAHIVPATTTVMAMPVNPSGIGSLTGVHAGLAVAFTPARTGRYFVLVTGSVSNSLASDGAKVELRFGGSTPPTFNATPTGSAVGKAVNLINNAGTAALRIPFTVNGVITGAGIGVTYWIDLVITAITGGTVNVFDLTVTAIEV